MRRFLTLICLLGLAIPAGISISGCTRNPQGNYCNGLGYGITDTQVSQITLQPQIAGISLAYGQTTQVQSPSATTCKGTAVSIGSSLYSYGTTNNQLVDISPTGGICAGTWNRNTGGGIADYTYCYFPNPLPSTNGLPYGIAYISATADSVTSNPVAVYVHAPVTSVSLVTTALSSSSSQCFSQNQQAQLNAQGCYASNGTQYEFCAPASVTSNNFACSGGAQTSPNIVASGSFSGPALGANGSVVGTTFVSGSSAATIAGAAGQTCDVSFSNGSTATATVALTGTNTIADGTALTMSSAGTGGSGPPSSAILSSGTATCSGTINLSPIYGTVGQYCNLVQFNNGSVGATATVSLTSANTITPGTLLSITSGGGGAVTAPTAALLTNGTADCSGAAAVLTTLTSVPSCGSSIGTLSFSVGTSSVASIDATTNVITAQQPGTTAITATIAQTASSAGYFSTCPPQSIALSFVNGDTSGVVTQGVTQNLTTEVFDTNSNPITGLSLTYQSTNPIDVSAGSGGSITAAYPGAASINAICEPPTCNPAPINEIGLYGTGLSLSSKPVNITVPGTASDYVWFGAPGQSRYIGYIQLLTGSPGSTVELPFVPNSMVMDRLGNNIYFGSPHELMVYSISSLTVTTQNAAVPGVVLAVSPNGSQLLINDQLRGVFYLYNTSGSTSATFGGFGAAASWTPDSNTLYIVDSSALGGGHTDTLYVYNVNAGWSTYMLACSTSNTSPTVCNSSLGTTLSGGAQSLAITVPGVGAYLSGYPTIAHTWCPFGTVGNNASMQFYPQQPSTDSLDVLTSVLGATPDGDHILGATPGAGGSGINLSDIGVTIPSTVCPGVLPTPPANGGALTPLSTDPKFITNPPLGLSTGGPGVTVTAVNQVVTGAAPTTASVTTAAPIAPIAFITYTTPSTSTATAQLPYYLPAPSDAEGSAGDVIFNYPTGVASTATAPLAGAFSPDNSIFFISTAGDNEIHFISIPANVNNSTAPPTDTQQISPDLPACTPVSDGGNDAGCLYSSPTAPTSTTYVPATVITVKPRSTT